MCLYTTAIFLLCCKDTVMFNFFSGRRRGFRLIYERAQFVSVLSLNTVFSLKWLHCSFLVPSYPGCIGREAVSDKRLFLCVSRPLLHKLCWRWTVIRWENTQCLLPSAILQQGTPRSRRQKAASLCRLWEVARKKRPSEWCILLALLHWRNSACIVKIILIFIVNKMQYCYTVTEIVSASCIMRLAFRYV